MNTHPTIQPLPRILDIAPYVGGASHLDGANRTIKLSANENPFGPVEGAIEAYRDMAGELGLYPEDHGPLSTAIGTLHGIDADRIVLGNGSDELIALLCKAYAGPGDEVLFSEHGFLMYKLSAQAASAEPVTVPERDLVLDVDAMIGAMTDRTRVVFVANPNNPTGTMIGRAELERLADALPPRALLVIDAAYAEYLDAEEDDGALVLAATRDNVVTTRTFSKIYGLAALRLGWCHGPAHVVSVLHRVRGPFNVTRPALAAGLAAIADQSYIEDCRVTNEVWRDWLAKRLNAVDGLSVGPSCANFLLVHAGEHVAAFDAHLKSRGLIARLVAAYGLPEHIRISVGDAAACRAVADAAATFRP